MNYDNLQEVINDAKILHEQLSVLISKLEKIPLEKPAETPKRLFLPRKGKFQLTETETEMKKLFRQARELANRPRFVDELRCLSEDDLPPF